MRAGLEGADLTRPARTSAVICAVAAVVVTVVFVAVHRPVTGGALAVGLLIGSINGFAVGRSVQLPVPFVATSLFRLMTMTVIGVGVGLAFGLANLWLVILGLGLAQIILAVTAIRQLVKK
jgi:hypothetical protein